MNFKIPIAFLYLITASRLKQESNQRSLINWLFLTNSTLDSIYSEHSGIGSSRAPNKRGNIFFYFKMKCNDIESNPNHILAMGQVQYKGEVLCQSGLVWVWLDPYQIRFIVIDTNSNSRDATSSGGRWQQIFFVRGLYKFIYCDLSQVQARSIYIYIRFFK